jgi:hypothetical protein
MHGYHGCCCMLTGACRPQRRAQPCRMQLTAAWQNYQETCVQTTLPVLGAALPISICSEHHVFHHLKLHCPDVVVLGVACPLNHCCCMTPNKLRWCYVSDHLYIPRSLLILANTVLQCQHCAAVYDTVHLLHFLSTEPHNRCHDATSLYTAFPLDTVHSQHQHYGWAIAQQLHVMGCQRMCSITSVQFSCAGHLNTHASHAKSQVQNILVKLSLILVFNLCKWINSARNGTSHKPTLPQQLLLPTQRM